MRIKPLIVASLLAAFVAPAGAFAATLDFDTLGGGGQSSAGNITGNEFAEFGVLISSNRQLALFDSNCGPDGSNSCLTKGTDADLATGPSFDSANENRVLIMNGGSDAEPNDDPAGGNLNFLFDSAVDFTSLRLIDLDEKGLFERITVSFTFGDNTTLDFSGQDLADRATLLNPGFPGDNSVRDIRFDLANVTEVDVNFRRISGAIAAIDFAAPVPLPAGLPLLAAGLGGLALVRRARRKA